MIIVLRAIPYVLPFVMGGIAYEQLRHPLTYPWLILVSLILLPVAAFAIAFRRLRWADFLEKMAPTFVLHAALAFGLLLAEGSTAMRVIIALSMASTFISLELLFLLAYHPARYPVNGLSHVNIAYVPIISWYAAATSMGLVTFLHTDRIWHVLLMTGIAMILFRTTGHPGATKQENTLWVFVGGLIGLHVGLIGLLLPLGMPMQGVVAALLVSGGLRARRYLYNPKPSLKQARIEAGALAVAFVALLTTAKWL